MLFGKSMYCLLIVKDSHFMRPIYSTARNILIAASGPMIAARKFYLT